MTLRTRVDLFTVLVYLQTGQCESEPLSNFFLIISTLYLVQTKASELGDFFWCEYYVYHAYFFYPYQSFFSPYLCFLCAQKVFL